MGDISTTLSIVHGSTKPELLQLTLGQLIDRQADRFGNKDAVIVPWSCARLSFVELSERTKELAKGLLRFGVCKGDRIALFSSDDERFIELFFAVGRIGAILVTLNKTYTVLECERAIKHSDTTILFLANIVSSRSTTPLLQHLHKHPIPGLRHIVLTRWTKSMAKPFITWNEVLSAGRWVTMMTRIIVESKVDCNETVNLQFTSGTTGAPKAAMLTHFNMINNGRFIGERLNLTTSDVVCCPPPLFHCFGLVAGFLAAFIHGAAIVFPSQDFNPVAVVDALVKENCTVLHGVPTMFSAILHHLNSTGLELKRLTTGIVAGSKVPPALLVELQEKLCYRGFEITYGMTETSPASFMTQTSDTTEQKQETVGKALPHVHAKVVDSENRVLPRGFRGELCISGYLLQQGYYKNPGKTAEAMIRDENGILWMHTGDEASIDSDGYCRITGRIKDIIIRGGENVYPLEIEERLLEHDIIGQASVVGLQDKEYGEVIAVFLQARNGRNKISNGDVKDWVRQVLGYHKAPAHVFWVGSGESITEYPATGSGKIRKDILRDVGNRMIKDTGKTQMAKL